MYWKSCHYSIYLGITILYIIYIHINSWFIKWTEEPLHTEGGVNQESTWCSTHAQHPTIKRYYPPFWWSFLAIRPTPWSQSFCILLCSDKTKRDSPHAVKTTPPQPGSPCASAIWALRKVVGIQGGDLKIKRSKKAGRPIEGRARTGWAWCLGRCHGERVCHGEAPTSYFGGWGPKFPHLSMVTDLIKEHAQCLRSMRRRSWPAKIRSSYP